MRRRANRYPLRAKGKVQPLGTGTVQAIETTTRNVSPTGLFLELNQDLTEGTQIRLTLEMPSEFSDKPVVVDCVSRIVRVVREADGKVGVGAAIEKYQFFRLPEKESPSAGESKTSQLPALVAAAEMTFGPKHPDLARSLFNVARLYFVQGKHAEATALCLRALAIDDTAPGIRISEVAQTLENYADLLRKLEHGSEAAGLEVRANTLRAAHGPEQRL